MKGTDQATKQTPDLFTKKNSRGGARPGGGRKKKYGEETTTLRVPVSKVEVIKAMLDDNGNTEQFEQLKQVIANWQEKVESQRAKKPFQRGAYRQACYLLDELQSVLDGIDKSNYAS